MGSYMNPLEIKSLLTQEGLSTPDTLTVAITAQCNLSCAHCWVDADPTNSVMQLPVSLFPRLLEDFVQLGGTGIRLTGGEPLLHPDWLGFLRGAAAYGLERIILQTNGILFSEADLSILRDLAPGQLQIQISLDGARASSHDLVRGAGTFQQTLDAMRKLVEFGFAPQLAIFFTEMRHNLLELPDVFVLASELGVTSVSSGTLVGCGRAETSDQIAPPDPEQYLDLLQCYDADETFRKLYRRIGCTAALEWSRPECSTGHGCAFIKTPYLTSTGTLYPCLMCHADAYAVDSVNEKGLFAAIIEGIPLWSSLQDISRQRFATIDACQNCRLSESCGAGCMGRAWGSFGDFLAVDDRCRQRQAVTGWHIKS